MCVFGSESEEGVNSLSKALTTMRLVSVGSINPKSPPVGKGDQTEWSCSDLLKNGLITYI